MAKAMFVMFLNSCPAKAVRKRSNTLNFPAKNFHSFYYYDIIVSPRLVIFIKKQL